jgi:5'-3' exonuclease
VCGDASDNIKGIKGVGEKTFLDKFPEVKERKVTLEEIIERARQINEDRAKEKKKPLKWAENIVNGVTDGVQGDKVYEINRKVIDLKNPILSEDAKELMDSMMHAPLDAEGRSLSNLYEILMRNGIDDLRDENRFSSFFYEYKMLIDRETR